MLRLPAYQVACVCFETCVTLHRLHAKDRVLIDTRLQDLFSQHCVAAVEDADHFHLGDLSRCRFSL